ncbi:AGAP005788-PA [Anopheles gambiae str. PEST]|uniref:AGAP005788-PA n=2 Tax=Anopheles gambiae TaxID=7165 RepID=A7UTW1_ANOGA|nr:AGAP005788-PA [Anopheles gambiae str. PEST]
MHLLSNGAHFTSIAKHALYRTKRGDIPLWTVVTRHHRRPLQRHRTHWCSIVVRGITAALAAPASSSSPVSRHSAEAYRLPLSIFIAGALAGQVHLDGGTTVAPVQQHRMCPGSQSSCAASRSPPVYPHHHRQRHHHPARPAQQFTGSDITVTPVQRYRLSGPSARGTTAAPCSAAHRRPNGNSIRRAASSASSVSGATTTTPTATPTTKTPTTTPQRLQRNERAQRIGCPQLQPATLIQFERMAWRPVCTLPRYIASHDPYACHAGFIRHKTAASA